MSDPYRDETASIASSSMDSYATPEERQAAKLARFKEKKRQGSARSSVDGGTTAAATGTGEGRPLPLATNYESPSVLPTAAPHQQPSRSSSVGGIGGSNRGGSSNPTSPHSSPSLHRAKTKLQLLHERLQNEALNENSSRKLDSPTMPPEIRSASNSVLLGDSENKANLNRSKQVEDGEPQQRTVEEEADDDAGPHHHQRSVSGAAVSPVPGATPLSGNSPEELRASDTAAPHHQHLGEVQLPPKPTPAPLLDKTDFYPTFSSPLPPRGGSSGQSSSQHPYPSSADTNTHQHPVVDGTVVRVQEPSSLGDTGTYQALPRVGSNLDDGGHPDRDEVGGGYQHGRISESPPPSVPPINMSSLGGGGNSTSNPQSQQQKPATTSLSSAAASASSYPAPPSHAPLPHHPHSNAEAAIVDLQRRLQSLPSTGVEAGRVSAVPSMRNSSGSPSQRLNQLAGPVSGASFTTSSIGILTDPVDFAYDYGGYTETNRTMLMIKESEAAARTAIVRLAMDEKIQLALELAHGPQRALTEIQRRLKDTIDRCVQAERALRNERKHREILDAAREEERKRWHEVDAQELLPQIDHAREKGSRELAGAEQRRVSELEALKDSHENEIDALHRQVEILRGAAEAKENALIKSHEEQLKLQRELEKIKTDLKMAKLMTPDEYADAEQKHKRDGGHLNESDLPTGAAAAAAGVRNGSQSPEARRVHIDPTTGQSVEGAMNGDYDDYEGEDQHRWVSPMTDEDDEAGGGGNRVRTDQSPPGSVGRGSRARASPKRLITALRLASAKRSTSAPRREGKPHDPLERKSLRGVHNQDQKPTGGEAEDFGEEDGVSSVAAPPSTFTLSFPELDHPSRRGDLFVGQNKASAWQYKYCFLSRGSFYMGESMETKITFTLHLSQVVRAQPFQGTHTTVKGHMKSTRKVHITHFFLVEYKPAGWRQGQPYRCLEFGLEDKFERNVWVEAFLFCKPQSSAMSTATSIGTKSIQSWALKK